MKILLLSHESDIDGMGSVVLSKIVFGDIEYELFPNVDELELKVRKYIEDNYFDDFVDCISNAKEAISVYSLFLPSKDWNERFP